MKKTTTISTLSCLLLLSVALCVDAAMPPQAVSAEKRRAMNKLDPSDIFSEARESPAGNRKNNRKSRRQKSEAPETEAATAVSTGQAAIASPSATPGETAEPAASPTPIAIVGETGWNTPSSSKRNLEATNAALSSLDAGGQSSHLLSLPVALGLFVMVLATLVFVFVKMLKNIRGSVN